MKRARLVLSAVCAAILGLSLISCGGGGDSTYTEVVVSGSPLRIIPGFTLNACIDKDTKTGYITPQTLMAAGGRPFPYYKWSIAFPPPFGMNVDKFTGVFSSTVPSSTLYIDLNAILPGKLLTILVSDGASVGEMTATGTVPLNISFGDPGVGCPFTVLQQLPYSSFALDDAYANQPYGATLFVMGGKPPYKWAEDTTYIGRTGLATVGLVLDPMYGLVRSTAFNSASGTTVKFRVIVTDSAGNVAANAPVYSIRIL